jgi:hypothetical protein
MTELFAAIIGALAAYVFDIRRSGRDRREREREVAVELRRNRASIATALIQDLRGLETLLRQFYHTPKPGGWIGTRPDLYFDAMRGEVRLFSPESVTKVDEFYRRADNLFTTLAAASPERRSDPDFHHFLRVTAGFALQALPPAKAALLAEGATIPEPRILETVTPPDLPVIPPRSFPDVAAAGSELPEELRRSLSTRVRHPVPEFTVRPRPASLPENRG